jgi:NTP pyrophosphatase (non-canonical NTP hydrolase)
MNELSKLINKIATEKGWHDQERTFGEYISLMHAELSEALEEYRKNYIYSHVYYTHKGKGPCEYCTEGEGCKCQKPEGIPIELADCIIRILDFCGQYNIDIEAAIMEKINYNKTRPYRHGNKTI